MRVVNKGKDPVAFRDDAGKHILKPRQSIEVRGDAHLAHILSLPGIEVRKGGRVPSSQKAMVQPDEKFG